MQDLYNQIEGYLNTLSISISEDLVQKYKLDLKDDDDKKTKKKIKKYQVEAGDNNDRAQEIVTKSLDDLYKIYETTAKLFAKINNFKITVEASQSDKQKLNVQRKNIESLYDMFKKKYDQQIANAQKVEQDQENKRKAIIEELQERIKTVQSKYQQAGKEKIEKYKENQTLKHQLSKYEPHLVASQSLADAQLKKKTIQIQIHMTTLKQKIDMMNNFKEMGSQAEQKIKKAKENQQKIGKRLKKLEEKEEQHKIALAKAHLTFEDYKKAFNVLKDVLPKKQRDAALAKEKLKKSDQSLADQKKKIAQLDKDLETNAKQLEVLQNLQKQLIKQLSE